VGFGLKNMSFAQLDSLAFDQQAATGTEDATPQAAALDLKQQAAERIRAHRERRARGPVATEPAPARQPHNPIAAAVAERYAQTPTYRAFLADQAQRAVEQAAREAQNAAAEAENAAAEAEVAARNAQAVAQVQQQLLAELELWDAPQQFTPETAEVAVNPALKALSEPTRQVRHELQPIAPPPSQEKKRTPPPPPISSPVKQISSAGLTVRLYEDIGVKPRTANPMNRDASPDAHDAEESRALDEEILFRQAPVFEPFDIDPPTPIPANLLEFPRQLIATRKARPRIAEGPLAEEEPRNPQLRIFEVEPEQISTTPIAPSVTPEWANIHLDAQPAHKPEPLTAQAAAHQAVNTPLLASMLPPQTAPLELRLMATAVDLILVGFAFTLFVGVTAHFVHRVPTGIPAAITAGITYAVLFPLYELLFFTLSDQTPGMRYARIGLCTLSDENPARSAIRRRILAQLIALCPFGLGILWALLDEDSLGWHDRISRMYQRAY
jgi:hypothetical protein